MTLRGSAIMYVLGIDPGTKCGYALLSGTNSDDIEIVLHGGMKNIKELSIFIPKYKTFKYKLITYFTKHLGYTPTWEQVRDLIDCIYIENQYLGVNPHTLKNIVKKRTWWEFALFQDFGNINKFAMPSSWQSKMKAAGKGIERKDRLKIVKQYILDKWGITMDDDPACAIGIAYYGLLSEFKLISDKEKPLVLN